RLEKRMPGTGETIPALVVGEDEDNVGPIGGVRGQGARQDQNAEHGLHRFSFTANPIACPQHSATASASATSGGSGGAGRCHWCCTARCICSLLACPCPVRDCLIRLAANS